jgi:hypothetical protein
VLVDAVVCVAECVLLMLAVEGAVEYCGEVA